MNNPTSDQPTPKRKGIAPWKIVVGMIVTCVVLMGLVFGGFVLYFTKNSDSLMRESQLARRRGVAFAQTHTQRECVEEAVRQLDVAGFRQQLMLHQFLDGCLPEAQATVGFCDEVPEESSILASVAWRMRACSDYGKTGDEDCARLQSGVQKFCHPSRKSPTKGQAGAD